MSRDDGVRVNQVWPPELKERVREVVGLRGLTAFTIEAVEEKLDRLSEIPPEDANPPAETVDRRERLVEAQPADSSSDERLDEAQALDLHTLKAQYGLVTAAEISKPVEAEVPTCETCGAALVDGECWACTF